LQNFRIAGKSFRIAGNGNQFPRPFPRRQCRQPGGLLFRAGPRGMKTQHRQRIVQ
jgi:hypothetical protein